MPAPLSRVLYLTLAAFLYLTTSFPALADSTVRIVRLSYVDGKVEIDRGASSSDEKAIINLPITQGTRLKTGEDGRAEVEFEDGSAVRLAPQSEAVFPRLSLRDSGVKDSAIEISKGTIYINHSGSKANEFTIQFGQEKILLTRAAHLRLGVASNEASVAVFKGEVTVNGPSGAMAVKRRQTAKFDLTDQAPSELAKKIEPQPFDAWDGEEGQYHERYAGNSDTRYSPYAYGTYDLAYYGNFATLPGYGMMWQPYFAGPGWDPFMNGAWSFYPGWGFGWVSAYPWGWLPYHYGTWAFVPGYGWMWQPGGVWTVWYTQPVILHPPAGFFPPRPPTSGTTTVFVDRGPRSWIASEGMLVLRANSAGLGVPRGEIENLRSLSAKAEKRGSAIRPIELIRAGQFPSGRAAPSRSLRAGEPAAGGTSMSRSHSGSASLGAPAPHR